MILALLVRFWKPLALLLVIAAAILWYRHGLSESFQRGHDAGYAKAEAENAAALRDWERSYDQQVKENARLKDAARRDKDESTKEVARLADLARKSQRRLVCHSPDRPAESGVSPTAGVHDPEAPAAGSVDRADAEDFDPTQALLDYATDVEYLTVGCRQLHQEVHGHPSAQ